MTPAHGLPCLFRAPAADKPVEGEFFGLIEQQEGGRSDICAVVRIPQDLGMLRIVSRRCVELVRR